MGPAFLIPLALSMAGTGLQASNTISANNKAQASAVQGVQQQQDLRQKASGQVGQEIQALSKSGPQQLAAKSTGDFIQQLRTNQAATNSQNSGAPSVAGANARYGQLQQANDAKVQAFGNTNAADLGQMTGAVQQRTNEGLGMNTLATDLGLVGAQSGNDMFVNNLRTAVAGQTNPYETLTSGLLGASAKGAAANMGGGSDANALTAADYANGTMAPPPANSSTANIFSGQPTIRYKQS
jgi:hypothetical protein